jgi:hypothetical protein
MTIYRKLEAYATWSRFVAFAAAMHIAAPCPIP